MHHLPKVVVGICLATVGCGFNIGTLQGGPVAAYQSGSQSRAEIKSSYQMPSVADRAGSPRRVAAELSVSDLGTGSVSKVVFDKSVDDTAVALHNGHDISVRLKTDSNVTGVIVDGEALMPTALRRTSNDYWQGSFHYWDASNTPKSKTRMTVLFISAKSSIRKTLVVTTVHDS